MESIPQVRDSTRPATDIPPMPLVEDTDLIIILAANNEAITRLVRELQIRVSLLEALVFEAKQ